MKKKVIAILCSAIIITTFGIIGVKFFNKKNQQSQVPTFQVSSVKKQQVINSIDVDGTVAFREKISIFTENAGKVQNIDVKEGDTVSKGDSIITYDTSTKENLERQLQEANLSLKSAKLSLDSLYIPADDSQILQLETQVLQSEKTIQDTKNTINELNDKILKAENDLINGKTLFEQGAISKSELTTLENALQTLKNQKISTESSLQISINQLEANKKQLQSVKNKTNEPNNKNRIESQKVILEQAKLRVSQIQKDLNKFKTNVLATENGTITKIFVSTGENVAEGKVVAEMGNLNDIIIQAFIPEYDMDGVKEGQKVTIKSESSSNTYEGIVTKVYPFAEKMNISGSEKNVVKVEISIPPNTDLKVGFTTKMNIITNVEQNATVIPIMSYMTESNSEPYVYIVKDDNTIEKRRVKLKSFQGAFASVEGVNEGEKVISSPNETIKEGMEILPIEENQQQELEINAQ